MSIVHKMLTMAEVGPNDFTFPGLQLVRQDNKKGFSKVSHS